MFRNALMLCSSGLIILGMVFFLGPGNPKWECQTLIASYEGSFPALDDPMRARFVECYYDICGIRLKPGP